ncbi:MAG TPA: hypothetical protein VNM34_14900 [Verrucomicrobiae bacterium]|nr:hypothetical protein [Verrucomicrobiae bacterium]
MSRNWAIFSREDIPDSLHPERTYLTRWRLLQTPWFGVYLHAIREPDRDRHMHDHPWSFVSVVLRGGYLEERPDGRTGRRRAGSVCLRRAEDLHRVALLARRPTWTLVLAGWRRRSWGFDVDGLWVGHREYFASRYLPRFGARR